MSNDDLVFYVKLSIRPDQVQAWRAALDTLVDRMAQEDAFVSCHLHRDAQDPNVFTLYERWREPSSTRSSRTSRRGTGKPTRRGFPASCSIRARRPC